jgi:hypothetical protein
MHNTQKNIDDLFKDKSNEHLADKSFAGLDFDGIKANLPSAPAVVSPIHSNPSKWLGVKIFIALTGAFVIIATIFFTKKSTNNNIANTKETTIKNVTDTNFTPTVAATILKDTETLPIENVQLKTNDTFVQNSKIASSVLDKPKISFNKKDNEIVIENFFKGLISQSQTFNINTTKDTVIVCKNGTKLTITANTFITLNKITVNGFVQLQVREAYSFTDIIANGLQTTSNKNLLESAGMVYLNAMQNNSALDININKPILLSMPCQNKRSDMQLFYLDKNANDNLINTTSTWIANGQKQDVLKSIIAVAKDESVETETSDNLKPITVNKNYAKTEKIYQFSVRNFGWINCDRFSNIVNKTDLTIELQNENDSSYLRGLLIFPKIKSVINLIYINKTFIQTNLPIGEEAYFVSFKTIDGKVLTNIQKIIITKDTIKADAFKDIPTKQVKATLDAIGSVD